MLDRDHRVADVLLESRRIARRRHLADPAAVPADREEVDHRAVVVGAEPLAADLDPDQLALRALPLDPGECILADEVRALLEVDHPVVAHADLVGVRVVPHVRAEGEDASLDAPDVARPDYGPVMGLAGLEDRVPQPGR